MRSRGKLYSLTQEMRSILRGELNGLPQRKKVFKDRARQDRYLKFVDLMLEFASCHPGRHPDPKAPTHRKLQKPLLQVCDILNELTPSERARLDLEADRVSQREGFLSNVVRGQSLLARVSASDSEDAQFVVDRIEFLVLALDREIERVAEGHPRFKGAGPPPATRDLIEDLARGWKAIFGKRPATAVRGAFGSFVNVLLGQLGVSKVGQDALTTILGRNCAPKKTAAGRSAAR
jgi:hypothetical protein